VKKKNIKKFSNLFLLDFFDDTFSTFKYKNHQKDSSQHSPEEKDQKTIQTRKIQINNSRKTSELNPKKQ
jgi:hypothetical protein